MNSPHPLRLSVWLVLLLAALILAAAGCDPVGDAIGLGERDAPSPTPRPFVAGTPGGKLSVWLITPTGQAATPDPGGGIGPDGNPVEPVLEVTRFYATSAAATATALAPTPAPRYGSGDCPLASSPAIPAKPQSFTDYADAIGVFLSAGGSTRVLEPRLRNWGAFTDTGGLIQTDTDITGDGVPEVIVTLFNPNVYNPEATRNAGQLLVFGCQTDSLGNPGYRLLYESPFETYIALPWLLRVGDMNGDARAELVYGYEMCDGFRCYQTVEIRSWNAVRGQFVRLHDADIIAVNGRTGIEDVDFDGVLELIVTNNAAGPTVGPIETWDWTGSLYRLATSETPDAPA